MVRRYHSNILPDDTLSVADAPSQTFELPPFEQGANAVPSIPDSESSSSERDVTDDMPHLLRDVMLEGGESQYAGSDIMNASTAAAVADLEKSQSNQSLLGLGVRSLPMSATDPAKLTPTLRAALCDYNFWMRLVERLGYDQTIYQTDTIPSLDSLSRYFDSSERGLMRVFHLFDKDHDSVITFEEIASGLRQQGIFSRESESDAQAALQEVCDLVASQGTRDVRPPEFLWALKNLRLAALMHGYPGPSEDLINLHLHEFKPERILQRAPMDSPVYFLFQPGLGMTEGMNVRWVHMHDASNKAVLGVAMKYGLDPRFVLDILKLWSEQARVDSMSFSGSQMFQNQILFVVVPVLRLTQRSEQSVMDYRKWKANQDKKSQQKSQSESIVGAPTNGHRWSSKLSQLFSRITRGKSFNAEHKKFLPPPCIIVEIEHCNLALLVAGQGQRGQVISFSSEWGLLSKIITDEDAVKKETIQKSQSKPVNAHDSLLNSAVFPDDGGFETPLEEATASHPDMAVFRKILAMLNTSYSILRTGDSQTFLLKTLCAITEDYRLVTEAYEAAIYIMQKRLEHEKDQTAMADLRKMRKGVRQLSHLYRLVRPMANVADTLTRMDLGADTPLYVSEISTTVQGFLDSVLSTRSVFRQMLDDYHSFSETRVTSTVFALTIVFTICAPGQFIAAVYGMNFRDSSGTPTIPELNWGLGYMYYWLLVASFTICLGLVIYFKRKRGWIN